jgi:hypothetical protein
MAARTPELTCLPFLDAQVICAMGSVNFYDEDSCTGNAVQVVTYSVVDAQRARRIMTLDRHLLRLGLTASLKDDIMVERARLLNQLPSGFDVDRFARLERKDQCVSANVKGIFHNVKQVFYPGDDDGNMGWYWRTRPSEMRKRAAQLEIEHDRWLPPKRQKELQAERKARKC